MADVNISDLTSDTTISPTDLYVFEDGSTGETKHVQAQNAIPGGTVTPEKLQAGTGTSWTWQSYTPTLGGLTIGNGTVTAKYTRIGKTCVCSVNLLFGSTTSYSGTFSVTLPVTSTSLLCVGTAYGLNAGISHYVGVAQNSTTTQVYFTDSSGTNWSTSYPFAWGDGDRLNFTLTYEVA